MTLHFLGRYRDGSSQLVVVQMTAPSRRGMSVRLVRPLNSRSTLKKLHLTTNKFTFRWGERNVHETCHPGGG
jgi:hypothetical protein